MCSSSQSNFLLFRGFVHALEQQHLACPAFKEEPGESSFLYFTLLFWNQIFTCFSDKCRQVAISILLSLDKYMLAENSRSNSRSCVLVNAVLMRLLESLLNSLLLLKEASDFISGGVGVDSRLTFGDNRWLGDAAELLIVGDKFSVFRQIRFGEGLSGTRSLGKLGHFSKLLV